LIEPDESLRRTIPRALVLVALALGLSTFAWWAALAAYPHTQNGDGQQHFKMLEAARWSVLRYHEFPAWNAYECGGVPLWDNPQAFIGAPLALVALAIGTTRAIDLWYVAHSAAGFLSMWLLLRKDIVLTRVACFIGSVMWAFSGFHQQHYGAGHVPFVPFEYFPLALFLWRRAERDLRYAIGLGALVALMIYEGAVGPLPHLVVVLGLETLFRLWPLTRALAILRAAVVVLFVGFLMGASRFIPVMHQLHIHTRGLAVEVDHIRWTTFKQMFLARTFEGKVPGQEWGWHEYGSYLGPFLLALAALGVVTESVANVWLVVLLTASTLLMFGHFARWAPWNILSHVFPFKEMRVPSRFCCEVCLTLSAFTALAIDRLPKRLARVWGKVSPGRVRSALVLFALIGLGDMLNVGYVRFASVFTDKPSTPSAVARHLYLGGKKMPALIDQPAENRARKKCWDEWGFEKGAPLWEGDVPQVRPTDPSVATVTHSARTQSSFAFAIDAREPTRILLNSSYDSSWRASVGSTVDADKQLAVDVPAGQWQVRVHYWPYGLSVGLALSTVSTLSVIAFFVWDARRRARLL
jgi:hypothetical protein